MFTFCSTQIQEYSDPYDPYDDHNDPDPYDPYDDHNEPDPYDDNNEPDPYDDYNEPDEHQTYDDRVEHNGDRVHNYDDHLYRHQRDKHDDPYDEETMVSNLIFFPVHTIKSTEK